VCGSDDGGVGQLYGIPVLVARLSVQGLSVRKK
jgi:hypothetical protein